MVGFKRLKASDPKEEELRSAWYEAKEAGDEIRISQIGRQLSAYIWQRNCDIVAEDRKRHPKAKRNAPKGSEGPSGGRLLP